MSAHVTVPPEYGPGAPSRRGVLAVGATLLAAVGVEALLPGNAFAQGPEGAPATAGGAKGTAELARYRPVTVSSTDYAPTPARAVVDGLPGKGVRGSGWRAAADDAAPTLTVDLQARCRVESVRVTFEASEGDPVFVPAAEGNPRDGTTGQENLSSYASAFTLAVSVDGKSWRTVRSVSSGEGGAVDLALDKPVDARWVRLSAQKLSGKLPLGVNGLEVYGRSTHERPEATGWTDWSGLTHHSPALETAADGTVALESGWALTMDDWAGHDGAYLSAHAVDTGAWLPAEVPGTVLSSLVAQKRLPDPVAGLSNLEIPEALSRHAWWYRREFDLPKGLATGRGRHVWLEFDGVNHRADVWVNGHKAGDLSYPFARAAFDVTELLAAHGPQRLAVLATPMPVPGSPGDKGPEGVAFVDAGANTMNKNAPSYLSVAGWDWMPAVRDRSTGLWNHVRLRSTGHAVLGDPRVDTKLPGLPDTDTAEITVTVPVRNAADSAQRVTVSAAFGSVRVSRTVTVKAGATQDVVFSPATDRRLRVRNPRLWWPNGHGEAYLYELTLRAEVGGATSDRRTTRFGMREFGYAYEVPLPFDNGGDHSEQTVTFDRTTARYLRLLCGARTTSWGTSLWRLSVLDGEGSDTDLARGKAATASSTDEDDHGAGNAVDGKDDTRWSSAFEDDQWLQVDLGAATGFDRIVVDWEQAYPKSYAVQVSDDGKEWRELKSVANAPTPLQISVNGVRVFCRGGNWGWDELLRRMPAERMDAAVRMHRDMNFTMIRNWVASCDREEFFRSCDEHGILVWNDFPTAWGMDPPDHEAFLSLAEDTVRRYRVHPSVVVWCGANEGNPPAAVDQGMRDAVKRQAPGLFYQNNSAGGIVSGGGPYGWTEPERYFDASTYGGGVFGFHTEIGMPTVPVAETMRNLVGEEPSWPVGAPWYHHDWSTKGNQAPQNYRAAIEERLGEAKDLEDFCRKAQFVNFDNTRAMFEAWNTRLWDDASGLLLWMSHPAWYSTVWQTYDYDFDVNGTYYGARKGCEPYHVQADPKEWRVLAVNHSGESLRGASVSAQCYDLKGRKLGKEYRRRLDVGATSTAEVTALGFAEELPALHLLRLRLSDAHGRQLSENTYWRTRRPGDLRALNSVAATRVDVRLERTGKGGARRTLSLRLRNEGDTVAAMTRVALHDDRSGERVLPTLYGDNYLWLLPGESRTISLEYPASALASGRPRARVEGYNVRRTEAKG